MVPSRVTGGLTQSSSSSGIYFQGDGQSHSVANTHLSSSFGNSSNSLPGTTARSNPGAVSGDMNNATLNSVGNSGPSVGASSLVTDANSGLSGGPHLQRSASINTESCMRLPASPLSFTSNNISISGSSMMDGSSVVHQNSHQDQTIQQMQQIQQQQPGNSSATSMPQGQTNHAVLPMVGRIPGSLVQDPNNLSHVQKKPRLDIKQEDILQQQVFQQLLQRPDPMQMQMQSRNPQLQALLQQQRLRQQQQILQSMPHLQRAQMQHQQQQQQQQQQLQLRQQMQQQSMQPMNALKRPYDSGVCARRLMQYLYHQRQRPPDNAIAYWRKFVAEYYSPRAKKRWCLSLYDNVGQHALGVFPQAAMDAWQCDICNSKSGRGFEATFEVLPRLNEIKFGSGVIDELLFLDLPKEYRTPTGIMVLEYAKAVQESVYEQLRVVREGHLRIVFAHDLKILSWEFCARRHEELLPRRLVAPQVNQLVQVAQKCHNTISESGADGISQQDLQANSNMILTAGRQLAKSLELQSLNDLGFSKRYVRCLQISEVVNSMKDLIDCCHESKTGPIDGLKNYPRQATAAKMQMQKMQEMEQLANIQGLPTDRTSLNKLMALHPGLTHHHMVNNNNPMANRVSMSGSAQAALALTSYQNLLMRQNSMNNGSNPAESPSFSNNSNQSPSSTFHGSGPQLTQSPQMHKLPGPSNGFSSPHLIQQQQQPVHQQQRAGSGGNPGLHNQMIHQLFQEMNNNPGPGPQQQTFSGQPKNGPGFGSNSPTPHTPQPSTSNVSGGVAVGPAMSRSNSFKATSGSNNNDSSAPAANGFNPRVQEMPQSQSLHHHDELVSGIAQEFSDGGFFGIDFEDAMGGFNWKV